MHPFLELDIEKCKNPDTGPSHFLWNRCLINVPNHGTKVPMSRRLYQDVLLRNIHENNRCLIHTGRQIGFSTISCFYSIWTAKFRAPSKTLFIFPSITIADYHSKFVSGLIENKNISDHVAPVISSRQRDVISFNNGSKIHFISSDALTRMPSILGSFDTIIIDGAAYMDRFDEMHRYIRWLHDDKKVIISSCISREGSYFGELMKRCISRQDPTYEPLTISSEHVPNVVKRMSGGLYTSGEYDGELKCTIL